jgi:UDPglucose--hexose-1-phosphate uridylyltransferase
MITPNQNAGKWEKRWHPLREEWVVYAAHRNARPWSGATVTAATSAPAYDPTCYLCPGNSRISGKSNPLYQEVYIFDNDHPVVGRDSPEIPLTEQDRHSGLYQRAQANGVARVVCYDPRHNVSMSELPVANVARVFRAWRDQMQKFLVDENIHSVLIFENKGEAVGVSNPHPHCQIYATDFAFTLVQKELAAAQKYQTATGANIFAAILAAEQKDQVRIIAENDGAIAFIPFFARYAYEVMIFPKQRHATLATLSNPEIEYLAAAFQEVIRRYDTRFQMSFPYVMSILQAPVDGQAYPEYHLHLLLQPPLRQPGLLKFLAGPEIGGGNFMADTMPEEKAAELRGVDISAFNEIM